MTYCGIRKSQYHWSQAIPPPPVAPAPSVRFSTPERYSYCGDVNTGVKRQRGHTVQCPNCATDNHRSADVCRECGVDLFAPSPTRYAEKAIVFLFSGSVLWLVFATTEINALANSRSAKSMLPVIIYMAFGKTLPVVGLLSVGALFSVLAFREKRGDQHPVTPRAPDLPTPPTNTQPPPTLAGARQLYRLLGGFVSGLAAVFVGMTVLDAAPLMPAGTAPLAAEYGPPAAALAALAAAFFVIQPRIPGRLSSQGSDEYWQHPQVFANVTLIWFLLEGAGVMAAIGYLLTGELLPTAVMAADIAAYWWYRPSLFLNE